ncbi:phospholipase-like protein, partial [Tanacetum coccineum]
DLSHCNTSIDNVWLTEDLDLYLGQPGLLRCRFPWCNDWMVDQNFWETLVCLDPPKRGWLLDESADWAMVLSYFVQLLLQNSMSVWYANGKRYDLPWSEVDQVNIGVLLNLIFGLVTFYDSGDTYVVECRDWSDNIPLEIQYEVMQRPPVKDLIHFRIVCKTWKSIVDNTSLLSHMVLAQGRQHHFL